MIFSSPNLLSATALKTALYGLYSTWNCKIWLLSKYECFSCNEGKCQNEAMPYMKQCQMFNFGFPLWFFLALLYWVTPFPFLVQLSAVSVEELCKSGPRIWIWASFPKCLWSFALLGRNVRWQGWGFFKLLTASSKQRNHEVVWGWTERLIIRDQEPSRIWIQSQCLGLGIEVEGVKDISWQYTWVAEK